MTLIGKVEVLGLAVQLRNYGWRAYYSLPDVKQVLRISCDYQLANPNEMYVVTLAATFLTLRL